MWSPTVLLPLSRGLPKRLFLRENPQTFGDIQRTSIFKVAPLMVLMYLTHTWDNRVHEQTKRKTPAGYENASLCNFLFLFNKRKYLCENEFLTCCQLITLIQFTCLIKYLNMMHHSDLSSCVLHIYLKYRCLLASFCFAPAWISWYMWRQGLLCLYRGFVLFWKTVEVLYMIMKLDEHYEQVCCLPCKDFSCLMNFIKIFGVVKKTNKQTKNSLMNGRPFPPRNKNGNRDFFYVIILTFSSRNSLFFCHFFFHNCEMLN